MNPATLTQYTHYEHLTARKIIKRIVIEADLRLETPAHFGNGDADQLTDMPLLVDAIDGKPLLTGASIAGALRAYLTECVGDDPLIKRLFGPVRAPENAANNRDPQSCLIIDDARGENYGTELRDGVAIDGASRAAADDKLYSQEFWQAGTVFCLRFELLITDKDDPDALLQALATALAGLADGIITLGARKSRGLGRVSVTQWRRADFDLTSVDGLMAWLHLSAQGLAAVDHQMGTKLTDIGLTALAIQPPNVFTVDAEFYLRRSLLIRTGGSDPLAPDMVHLSRRVRQPDGTFKLFPLLSGTSLAGALRARATKIANTIAGAKGTPEVDQLIDGIFGQMKGETKLGSRLRVEEHAIEQATFDLVQSRVSIDRFTGGAKDGALFNQQPVFAKPETILHVRLRLISRASKPVTPKEIGLLMLVIKDLWTGDLPLGGESSVGRGRLLGKCADIKWQREGQPTPLHLTETENGLAIEGEVDEFEKAVTALNECLKRGGQ